MYKKTLNGITCFLIASSMFSSIAAASSEHTLSKPVTESIIASQLAETKLSGYSSTNEYEKELSSFVNNVMLVKPFEEYTEAEKLKWEQHFNNLKILLDPLESASTQNSAFSIYNDVQKGIEATITTARYGAIVAGGVLVATNRANDEQVTYMRDKGFKSNQENEVDAFRHFSWNYHMTDTITITRGMARVIGDNHEFSAHGARYGVNNWPNSPSSYQIAQGVYYTNKIKEECESSDISVFKKYFVTSNFMDFNNNEAGRAYEGKNYSNNFTAFEAALKNGHVTTSPSQWSYSTLSNRAFNIFKGTYEY